MNALVDLPNDPFAREAVMLARRYLHGDHNLDILETLLANEHSAYREALAVLKCTIPETGTAIPEQLRVWEPDGKGVIERLRRERTRNQLTGFPGPGVRIPLPPPLVWHNLLMYRVISTNVPIWISL